MYAAHDEVERIGQRRRGRRCATPTWTPAAAHAVHPVRVRATPWATAPAACATTSGSSRRYDRCQGGFVWEWIDHGIAAHARRCGLRLRRRLRRGTARRQLRLRRAGLPGPHSVAGPDRVQEGHRAGPDRGATARRGTRHGHQRVRLRRPLRPGLRAGPTRWTASRSRRAARRCPPLAPGRVGRREAAPAPPRPARGGEAWWTVRAVLAEDTAVGAARARGRLGPVPASRRAPRARRRPAPVPRAATSGGSRSGRAPSTPRTGALRDDRRRRPVDAAAAGRVAGADRQRRRRVLAADARRRPLWRALGLHRMRHRLDGVERRGRTR